MADSNGSNSSDRLDRIERLVEVLVNTQADMQDTQAGIQQDIKNLTFSQVSMGEALNNLTLQVTKLAESQQHTDDRLNALIDVVDKWIRRP